MYKIQINNEQLNLAKVEFTDEFYLNGNEVVQFSVDNFNFVFSTQENRMSEDGITISEVTIDELLKVEKDCETIVFDDEATKENIRKICDRKYFKTYTL